MDNAQSSDRDSTCYQVGRNMPSAANLGGTEVVENRNFRHEGGQDDALLDGEQEVLRLTRI